MPLLPSQISAREIAALECAAAVAASDPALLRSLAPPCVLLPSATATPRASS